MPIEKEYDSSKVKYKSRSIDYKGIEKRGVSKKERMVEDVLIEQERVYIYENMRNIITSNFRKEEERH